jgi:hypothetical protein
MARRVEHVEAKPLDRKRIALRDPHRHDVDFALFTHHGDAMRAIA